MASPPSGRPGLALTLYALKSKCNHVVSALIKLRKNNAAVIAPAKGEDKICEQHTQWVARWNNDNPFSSLFIFKNDTDEMVGHVLLGDGDQPGFAELAYVFDKKFWGQGYGKEVIPIIVQEYAPELVERNYKLIGENFKRIEATARPDNPASINLLKAAGLKKFSEKPKWGQVRHFFFLNIMDLKEKPTEFLNDSKGLENFKLRSV
jgi:RimJ/RimL family protein N-acetyltransferase